MCLSYLLDADLVGNKKKLTSEVSVSDLEYADDMELISDSYESLSTLLKSLDSSCHYTGLTINYKKTKLGCHTSYTLKFLLIKPQNRRIYEQSISLCNISRTLNVQVR